LPSAARQKATGRLSGWNFGVNARWDREFRFV
jgi:hypothetical protein